MQILINEITRLRQDLNNIIEELKKAGYSKAQAEHTYRVALAKELLRNKDKGLAATLNNDVSRGNEIIAKYKFDRDVKENLYESTLEKLRVIKIELGIVERQMEATRRGSRRMTNEELLQLKHLKSEVRILKTQIEDLDFNIVTDSVKGSSKHFPYTEHNVLIKGIDYDGPNNKLNRLQRKLNRRIEDLLDLVDGMNDYIEGIEDSLARQVITLRYINNLSWNQVACNIGGNNTADSVRKVAQRYLKQ